MIFGTRKVESLSYRMVKKIAEKFNRLSRVHQRHRQTDNRQTTDGRLIAHSERNVVRSLKTTRPNFTKFSVYVTCGRGSIGPCLMAVQ